jgi:hypothetical protein
VLVFLVSTIIGIPLFRVCDPVGITLTQ